MKIMFYIRAIQPQWPGRHHVPQRPHKQGLHTTGAALVGGHQSPCVHDGRCPPCLTPLCHHPLPCGMVPCLTLSPCRFPCHTLLHGCSMLLAPSAPQAVMHYTAPPPWGSGHAAEAGGGKRAAVARAIGAEAAGQELMGRMLT